MKIIKQSCSWISPPPPNALQLIERCGRTCYKSEDKITQDSAEKFVRNILSRTPPHESVIEHISASMLFVTDRGVLAEKTRHRIASYSVESSRYCDYNSAKFNKQITYVDPVFWQDRGPGGTDAEKFDIWMETMIFIEKQYQRLITCGAKPEEARSVLPNSLKTEIVMTANMREWRHFFRLRTAKSAHPQMRDIAKQALYLFRNEVPVLFEGIGE